MCAVCKRLSEGFVYVVCVGNRCSTTPHGGNTVAIPLGGNGHVTPSRPTHGLGIGLLMYLRSFSPT